MTDHDLRSLLRDQVADVTTTADLSAGAWRTSRGVRRRRTLGVVAGAAAATLLVVGGIAVLGNESDDTPDPAPPSPTPGVNTTPDGHFRGAPVYWSPSLPEEADLPVMTEGRPPLPEVIDLSAEATPVEDDPIDRAVAVFGVLDDTSAIRFLLLAPDGTYRTLDLSDVGPDPIVSCCERPPLRDTMLSPTGEYVLFPQLNSVLVYDLPQREWRTIETGDADATNAQWSGPRAIHVARFTGGSGPVFDVVTGEGGFVTDFDLGANDLDLEEDQSYRFGPARIGPDFRVLQSWGSGAKLPVPDNRPRPEFLVVDKARTWILSFTGSPGGDDRWLQCCPVVGWAGDDVALYESRSGTPRIIAWTVGTHRFETVSTITGFTPGDEVFLGSYADLWR
jgi:hypothetical protein